MKPKQSLPSGMLSRRLQAAEAAWQCKDFQQCIELLESAQRLAPANTGILLQLGRIYGLRYDYASAERCFEQALRLQSGKAGLLTEIVEHCKGFRNPAVAERYLRLAIERKHANPLTFVKLAELCERLRRIPEAKEHVSQALRLEPACPAALLVQARLERLDGNLKIAEQVLGTFIHKPMADTWVHAQAWYELAQNLDRQKRFDEAMGAFVAAKKLLQPQAAPYLAELKAFRARLKVMEANVSPEILGRWQANHSALVPGPKLAFLTGHARSGTTLLEQVLDSHPNLISAEETSVFLEDVFAPLKRAAQPDAYMLQILEPAQNKVLESLRAAYFRSMELNIGQAIADRMLIDKNPGLLYLIPAFIRVFPETKFLVALRDPRDVVLSCFMQAQSLNPVTASFLSLEGTVMDYAELMHIWLTLKPMMSGQFLEVRYEDMVEDLESVARKTLEFLGVPWDAQVLGFDEHARKKMVISPTYADVTQKIYTRAQGRWRNYQKYLEPHLEKLEPFVKAFGYG